MKNKTAAEKREISFLRLREDRNYGVDLLRIVAMFMVVVLHVLGSGGIIWSEEIRPGNYWSAWFLEIAAYGAVDIYALISGFVGYKTKHRYANLAVLWLSVFFYSASFTVINKFLYDPSIGKKKFLAACFPVLRGNIWYFTMYFCLFFFMPLLNAAIERVPRRTMKTAVISLVALFSLIPLLWDVDPFYTMGGYSLLWLIVLYVIGAYIGKYRPLSRMKKTTALLGYLLCVCVVWASKYILKEYFPSFLGTDHNANWLVIYTSFPILASAVFLLLIFRDVRLPVFVKKAVATISPLTFGIFVIHVLPLFNGHVIKDRSLPFASYSPIVMLLAVLGASAAIFAVCAAIDFVRARLFDLLKVKERLLKLEKKLLKE